jgi:TatD DNase family protein
MKKPKYIDTHAHVQADIYDEDRDEVVKRTLEQDTWMINVGTRKETSKSAVNLANKYEEGVYAIIGLIPTNIPGEPFFDKDFYFDLAQDSKVVGIGECGLDFFKLFGQEVSDPEEIIKKQRKIFSKQIELAIEVDKPLMIHCRDAYKEVLQILTSYKLEYGDRLRGNVHFFAGTIEEAQKFLDLGFNLSFTGVITFAKDYKELVEYVPIDRMLSETDCPYVAPEPYRGKRNEPLYVSEVVKKIAKIKKEDEEKIAKQLVDNAFDFFRL